MEETVKVVEDLAIQVEVGLEKGGILPCELQPTAIEDRVALVDIDNQSTGF